MQEYPPGFGQGDITRGAQQQHRVELALEPFDRPAQCRLGDMQALGGAAEMQILGDGDEIAQMMQLDIHIDTFTVSNNSKLILDEQ